MKKMLIVLVMVGFLITGCTSKSESEFKVGVIQWGEHPALQDSLDGMKEGLVESGVSKRIHVEVKNANEDASNASMIASQFVSENVDLIFAIATPSAQIALSAVEGTDIPVVFSAVSDPLSAGLVENPDQPEGLITGVSDLPPLEKQVRLMQEMLPTLRRIGILFNTSEINSQNQIEDLKTIANPLGLEIVEQGVSSANEIAQATAQLASSVDALFIVNDNMIATATGLVVQQASKEGKPVFMAESGQFDQGILASDSISYKLLGIQAGHMVKAILIDNTPIASLPVQTASSTELFVSETVAKDLGINIPETILERAILR